jgi:ribosome-associated toxin RatA of RatAB toxin-antitoxin module
MLSNNVLNFNQKWTKIVSNEGVICYERKLTRSYYLEHRADAVIDSSIENVVEVLKDIPAYPKWMYNCTEAKILEGDDELSKVIYYAQGSSFGNFGSDIILSVRALVDLNSGKMIITLKSIDDHAYRHPDIKTSANRIRLTSFRGSWRLEAQSKTSTIVNFTVHANPGKQKREYMVNNLMKNICFYSLQKLLLMV